MPTPTPVDTAEEAAASAQPAPSSAKDVPAEAPLLPHAAAADVSTHEAIAQAGVDPALAAAPTPVLTPTPAPAAPPAAEDGTGAAPSGPAAEPKSEAGFRPRFDTGPVRFSWQIDAAGRFRSFSPEFAATVGPRSADVIGKGFAEVAARYGLDPEGEIARLLSRRETWSGRSLEWPVENSDRRMPVDLAALPTFGRDRAFDGFRGFGILRPSESVEDPRAVGLSLEAAPDAPAADEEAGPQAPSPAPDPLREALMAASAFGRRPGAALPAPEDQPGEDEDGGEAAGLPPKVIRLEERRRAARSEAALTPDEEDAFRAIGSTLAESPEAERLSRAVVEASERLRSSAADETGPPGGSEAEGPDEPMLGDLEAVFSALPLPILVQMRETLVAANAEFLEMTGYPSVAALAEAGGLAHLFAESGRRSAPGLLTVRRADGGLVPMRVHMQRAGVRGRSCLVMSFSPEDGAQAALSAPGGPERVGSESGGRAALDAASRLAVLDATTEGLVVFDAANRVEAMDEAAHALFGIPAGEVEGRPLTSLFALDSQKAVLATLSGLWAAPASAPAAATGRDVLGRTARGGFQPLAVRFGRLSASRGWCAVMREDAERHRIERDLVLAQRRAEAANVQKSRFLANVSHELRTPLNAIIGFADVMSAEAFGPLGNERYLEYLADIKRSGHHLLDLVNDLLDISKIEAGKWDLDMRPLELNDLVAEAVGLIQTEAQRARVILRTNLPRSVPAVTADGRSIRQIALNLLANAVRFTPAGGQIVVSTSHSLSGEVILRVRDTGIGMTREEIEVALSPFGQVRAPDRPEAGRQGSEGTGLGLPLSRAIAEANGARFTVASTPGEGTVVEIAFPAEKVVAAE